MKLLALFAIATVLGAALPALAPTAAAAPCYVLKPATCIEDPNSICVFSYTNEPGCIVPNPCDPRFCDVWLLRVLAPFLP